MVQIFVDGVVYVKYEYEVIVLVGVLLGRVPVGISCSFDKFMKVVVVDIVV